MASDVFRLGTPSKSPRSPVKQAAMTDAVYFSHQASSIMQHTPLKDYGDDSKLSVTKIASDVFRVGSASDSPRSLANQNASTNADDYPQQHGTSIMQHAQLKEHGDNSQPSAFKMASDVFRVGSASESLRSLANQSAQPDVEDFPQQHSASIMQHTQLKDPGDNSQPTAFKMASDVFRLRVTAGSSSFPANGGGSQSSGSQSSGSQSSASKLASDDIRVGKTSESPPSSADGGDSQSSPSNVDSRIFRLGTASESPRSLVNQEVQSNAMDCPQHQHAASIMQYTQLKEHHEDLQSECKQS
jgi:hypothetical protein